MPEMNNSQRQILRWKIHALTAVLGAFYLVLTYWCLTGGFARWAMPGPPNLFTLLLLPIAMFMGPMMIWLTFAVQLTLVDLLAQRMPFRWNALLSILAGPVAAAMILRLILYFHALLS